MMAGRGEIDGRAAAQQALVGVLTRQMFVGETLSALRDAGELSPREGALATEIALGTVRHLLTIDHVLGAVATYDSRNVSHELRALLAAATYQIVWMDRIPPFAAVNETVRLAQACVPQRAKGMVNAVLRRLTDALAERRVPWNPLSASQVRVSWDEACAFDRPVFPPPDPEIDAYLAAAAGERPERLAKLTERFGASAAGQIAWASQALPCIVLQRNPLAADQATFEQELTEQTGGQAQFAGGAAFVPPSTTVVDLDAFRQGHVYVQDTAAQHAASLVAARPGERVLDLCAAPGGKSMAMAGQLQDDGEVVACDVSAPRLIQVSANADRLGLHCVRTHLLDEIDGDDVALDGTFDAAIVDVPCSNTGVIARRPEARLGLTAKKVRSLQALQRRLIARAAARVRAGGRLVYSTCCLEPQECEEVVDAFVGEHGEWSIVSADLALPQWGPALTDWRDGGFAALLQRG